MKRCIPHARAICLLAAFVLFADALHSQKTPPAAPLDLNSATIEQLEQLPGVGPTIADAIVRFREKSGPLHRVEDLLAVRGVSKTKLEGLRPYVFVAVPARKSPPQS
jgi:competence ComEA-like helix-hairpin-helix protein